MKQLQKTLFLWLLIAGVAFAQECGPSCPVCSGNSEGALLAQNFLLISGMVIPMSEDEKIVINCRYGILPRIDAGIGYAVRAGRLLWNVRVQPLREREKKWRPGVILGAGSVRAGGSDQSVYAQITKSWEFTEAFAFRINAGATALIPEFNRVFGLAGITSSLFEMFSVFASYDGRSFHEGASWIPLEWMTVSALLVESKQPAVSVIIKWQFFSADAGTL